MSIFFVILIFLCFVKKRFTGQGGAVQCLHTLWLRSEVTLALYFCMIKKCIFVFSYLRIFLFISYFCVLGNLHLLDSVLFLDPTSEVELWYYLWIEWTEEMKIFWAHTVLVWIPLLYLAGTLPISICGLFTDSQNTIINSDGDHSIPFHVCSVYRVLCIMSIIVIISITLWMGFSPIPFVKCLQSLRLKLPCLLLPAEIRD